MLGLDDIEFKVLSLCMHPPNVYFPSESDVAAKLRLEARGLVVGVDEVEYGFQFIDATELGKLAYRIEQVFRNPSLLRLSK